MKPRPMATYVNGMHAIAWGEVIAHAQNQRFGDMKCSRIDGSIRKGPLSEIRIEGRWIVFATEWMGHKEPLSTTFKQVEQNEVRVLAESVRAYIRGDGKICFTIPGIGDVQLLQRHVERLEKHDVVGLEMA